MSWVKIDDRLPEHPKFFATSCRDRALNLYIIALCYCSRNLTDGVVPKAVMHEGRGAKRVCESMVAAGLFTENSTSYVVKDYLEWNRSKEQVKEIQAKRRKAGQAGGEASWLKRAERLSEAKANPDTDTDTDKVKTIVRKPAKSAGSDGFDEWWEEQARKEGKGAARASYAKALKRTDKQTLLDSWRRSKAAYEREDRSRDKYPLPATWLNQERWADEYDEVRPQRAMRAPCTNPDCINGLIYDRDTDTATKCPDCRGA